MLISCELGILFQDLPWKCGICVTLLPLCLMNNLFSVSHFKRVRFSTAVLFSLGIGVELLTPAFPQYFLLLASIANIVKQISLGCYLSTAVRIHNFVSDRKFNLLVMYYIFSMFF